MLAFHPTLTEEFLIELIRAETADDFESVRDAFLKRHSAIDWAMMLDHGLKLTPSLCVRLMQYCQGFQIPAHVISKLKFAYLSSVERNKKVKEEMEILAKEFSGAGIDLIFLKGAALLVTLYRDDEGLRPMDDMDVLIRREDISETEKILDRTGYVKDYARFFKQFNIVASRDFFLKRHFHLIYYKGALRLELHLDISLQNNAPALNMLWRWSEPVKLGETKINVFNAEATIFMTCLNFHKDFSEAFSPFWRKHEHARQRAFCYILFFLFELKKILVYYRNIDWSNLYFFVKLSRREYEIYSLLILAKKIINADVPNAVLQHAKHNVWLSFFILCTKRKTSNSVCELFLIRERIFSVHNNLALLYKNPMHLIWGLGLKMQLRRIKKLLTQSPASS